jgi:uncharacterized membrane protein YdjX (TVP38/TMEM64 family)
VNPARPAGRRLLAAGLFIGLLFVASELAGLRQNFSLEFLQQQILAHKLGGLVLFVLLFALGNLIQIPGWLFLAAAVLALGRLWGGLVTYLAASLACVSTFLLVRLLGGDALRQLPGRLAGRIFRQLDDRPLTSVVLLRLLFQTMPAVNCALALSGVHFRHYLAGTLLGLPLPIALYCLLFDTLARHLV